MRIAKTMEQFYRYNDRDVCRIVVLFMKDSTDEDRKDVVQGFYYAMLNYKTLDDFEPIPGNTLEQDTKMFESYIWRSLRNFCNNCHRDDKSKVRRYELLRSVKVGKSGDEGEPVDVSEVLGCARGAPTGKGSIGVHLQCEHSVFSREQEEDVSRTLQEFKDYLGKVKESARRRQLMLKYIEWSAQDIPAAMVAESENVSSTYIKDIKHALIRHYEKFQKIQKSHAA